MLKELLCCLLKIYTYFVDVMPCKNYFWLLTLLKDRLLAHEKGKPRLQLPSYVRWILWVLLVQIILINISAAFYAHKLTHVYTDRALRSARPSKTSL